MYQTETGECGLACLIGALRVLGSSADVAGIRQKYRLSNRGLTMRELRDVAAGIGMAGRAVRCEPHELRDLKCPAILHWGMNHFVLLESASAHSIRIMDPAMGSRVVTMTEIGSKFTGAALELARAPDFVKRKEKSPLGLFAWVNWGPQLYGPLCQMLLLSLLLQAYVIASPLYLQSVVDQGAMKGDLELLTVLAIGFGMACLFNATASWLRDVVAGRLTMLLSWDMSVRLFRHLIRLPLPWFERRRLADILSRMDAIVPLRSLVSGIFVSAVIDGLLAVITLGMMFYFAPKLALVALAGMTIFVAVRLSVMPMSLRLGGEALTAHIFENGKRIEIVRSIQTVKAMSAEQNCGAEWENKYARAIVADQRAALLSTTVKAVQTLFDGLVRVLLIYFGATAIVETTMTVGMLYAFLAYQNQFASKCAGLFDQLVTFRMTDLYSHRLADIVLTKKEDGIDVPGSDRICGAVQLVKVGFTYGTNAPWALREISLDVQPGEFVAIVGSSGAGKSTLLKVIAGLYAASKGTVLFDGRPAGALSVRSIRQSLGVVLQDDELLSGTVAENVALFDEVADSGQIWEALSLAGLDEDVRRMPLQIHTHIGDMASGISEGQKQRILLARALFRKPSILLLDEATCHLDGPREAQINAAIKSLRITRIVVTHRQETIGFADRILRLHNGTLFEEIRTPIVS